MAIQIKRDTAANWTSNNPTLSSGQPGFETDTGLIKIGDGSTAWTSLAYLQVDSDDVDGLQAAISGNAAVTANTAKTSNATHTGEVTGDGALTVDPTAISNKTAVTPATDDYILIGDTSDSNNLKKALISGLPSGAAAIQSENAVISIPPFLDWSVTTSANAVGSDNAVYILRFTALFSIRISRIRFRLDSGSGTFTAGIYNADGSSKLTSTGAVAWSTNTFFDVDVSDYTLQANTPYIAAWTTSVGSNTVRGYSAAGVNGNLNNILTEGLTANNAYYGTAANSASAGVLPATLGNLTQANITMPRIFLIGG